MAWLDPIAPPRGRTLLVAGAAVLAVLTACTTSTIHSPSGSRSEAAPGSGSGSGSPESADGSGFHKIVYVIVIMRENRSFDTYFGAHPGADGIPMSHGKPSVCVPAGPGRGCVRPYVDHADVNGGGPHGQTNAAADIDGGHMNGFITQASRARRGRTNPTNPACANSTTPDVIGYHTRGDIPNYWSYALDYLLQDQMFEPNACWSLPSTCSRSRSGRY
jgi:phospholipase C